MHQPVAFSQLQSLMRWIEPVTEELWLLAMPFFYLHAHAQIT